LGEERSCDLERKRRRERKKGQKPAARLTETGDVGSYLKGSASPRRGEGERNGSGEQKRGGESGGDREIA